MIRALLFNRRLLALAVGFLLVLGFSAVQTLPRLEDPSLVVRNATVLTFYPGADAERVEALVSKPIEDALRGLSEIKTLASTSRAGISLVAIELRDEIVEVAPVWSLVRDKLDDAAPSLPPEAGAPRLDDERGAAYTLQVSLTWTGEGPANGLILRRYAEALQDRLRNLPGTDHVRLYGAAAEQIEVILEPAALAAAGLSVDRVAAATAAADVRAPAGEVVGLRGRFPVELDGSFDSLERLRAVPLAGEGGQALRLGDLAAVRRGLAEPPGEIALFQGRPAIHVAARMGGGLRVDGWAAAAREAVADFAAGLPPGIEAAIAFDQSGYTEQRLAEVTRSLLLGLAIVVAVLFLTMGWRSALVVGLALPVTALLALGLFRPLGLEIHQMSVIGMIVALGLMVDNAIVMTNAVRHDLVRGLSAYEAVRGALRGLALPLAASTVTTVLAFMPIVLLPGGAGEFIGPLALAVIAALLASYLVAIFFVPAFAPLLFGRAAAGGGWLAGGLSLPILARGFRGLLRLVAARPIAAIAAAFALPVIGFASFPTFQVAFFPPVDRDQFRLELRLPAAASIRETEALVQRVDAELRATEGVRQVQWTLGASAPMVYYNVLGGEDANPAFAMAIVDTASLDATTRLVPELQRHLDAAFPEAQTVIRSYEQGPPFQAPLELRVYGPELSVLADLGRDLAAVMAATPQVTHARALLHADAPKLRLAVDEQQARLAGLDLSAVAGQLDAALAGRAGGFLLEETQRLPVVLRYPEAWRADPQRLAGLPLAVPGALSSGGAGLPLAAVAEARLEPAWSGIERRDGGRLQIVRGYLEAAALPSAALTRIEAALAETGFALPPGYRLEIGGEAEQRGEAVGKLLASVAMLVVLMVTTVALTFNSFRRTAIVFLAGLQALGLGLLALKLTGFPFGFVIIVGVMGLVGVAINASIIIVSALDADPAARRGEPAAIAAVVGGPVARHVWSTTITTVGGFVPLMLAPGAFWPPFAQTVAGGLALATVIAFLFTPAAYRLLALSSRRRGQAAAATAPA